MDGGVGEVQLKIGVQEVVEALHEDGDNAESNHSACYRGDDPVDGRCETSPAEPALLD